MAKRETIVALSSGGGRAGVAVIRASGPDAAGVLKRLVAGAVPPRLASLRTIRHPESCEPIDRGLVFLFPGPASFTGEDVFELHVHGGRAVVAAAIAAVQACRGVRLAEPGEFTRRAFEAGKLDLTAVEGLADLVTAETEMQRRVALRSASGELARQVEAWRERLLAIRARVEAAVDFSDEDGVPDDVAATTQSRIEDLAAEIAAVLGAAGGERVRAGVEIVMIGRPNSGKSTLVNAIAGREVAIVSPEAGTTRDLIEVRVDLGGYAATLVDAAGLRDAAVGVEGEGVRRAQVRARDADLVLVLGSADVGWPDWEQGSAIRVWAKADLLDSDSKQEARKRAEFVVSGMTGEGVAELLDGLASRVAALAGDGSGIVMRARQREALDQVVQALNMAVSHDLDHVELAAEELRRATDALGRITGRLGVEDVLGEIFAEFCIGK